MPEALSTCDPAGRRASLEPALRLNSLPRTVIPPTGIGGIMRIQAALCCFLLAVACSSKGVPGAQGPQGPQGPAGVAGAAGASAETLPLELGDTHCPFGGAEVV